MVIVACGSISYGTIYFNGTQTLTGTGSVVLAPYYPGSTYAAGLQITGTLTQATGHTISGAGRDFEDVFVNQGLINANVPGDTLGTNGASSQLTNAGIMEATNGGILLLSSPINNAGGTILASGGTVEMTASVKQLSGGTLTGGTWIAQAGSPLLITSGSGYYYESSERRSGRCKLDILQDQ